MSTKTPPPCGKSAARRNHQRRGETCHICGPTRPRAALAPCGTRAARRRHRKNNEPCNTCHPEKRQTLRPCGTLPAYKRHKAHGEQPCQPCITAFRDEKRRESAARYRRNHPNPKTQNTITTEDLINEIRFMLRAGEGTARILQAVGYTGREKALADRLQRAGHSHLTPHITKPWELAA